ncbi:hypothetical protein [Streptomyces mayteni]
MAGAAAQIDIEETWHEERPALIPMPADAADAADATAIHELPLTSEPPLGQLVPLTAEKPLALDPPLTSEPSGA